MPHLLALIGEEPLKKQHPLDHLSENDVQSVQVIDDAIGIMQQKMKMNGKEEKNLRGRVRDPHSFVGLLSELFWCHRLTRLGYSFNVESKTGGTDFKIKLNQRTVCVEVKTLQKGYGSNQKNELILRLRQAIQKQIASCPGTFLISVGIKRNFSNKTIKPLAAKVRRSLQEMSTSKKENTFKYPAETYGYNREAEVTIRQGRKTNILISSPASLANDDKLLQGTLDTARRQFNQNDVNVVFVDKTFRPTLDNEEIQNTLYGKLVHDVSFDQQSGEPKGVTSRLENNGFYQTSSRISAVIVYRRIGMLDIQDANVYLHPKSCKLTKAEMDALKKLSGC